MTQQALAAAASVDLKTVNSIEARGSWPQARTRARIEKALGWPPGEYQRIAEEEPEAGPELDPDLLAAIRRTIDPEDQQNVIDAILATMRGGPPPPSGPPAAARYPGDRRRAG